MVVPIHFAIRLFEPTSPALVRIVMVDHSSILHFLRVPVRKIDPIITASNVYLKLNFCIRSGKQHSDSYCIVTVLCLRIIVIFLPDGVKNQQVIL